MLTLTDLPQDFRRAIGDNALREALVVAGNLPFVLVQVDHTPADQEYPRGLVSLLAFGPGTALRLRAHAPREDGSQWVEQAELTAEHVTSVARRQPASEGPMPTGPDDSPVTWSAWVHTSSSRLEELGAREYRASAWAAGRRRWVVGSPADVSALLVQQRH